MTLLINIQINLLFKRKFPIGLTSKFGNLVWPNARAALVLSVSPMFYTGFESLNSVDGLCRQPHPLVPNLAASTFTFGALSWRYRELKFKFLNWVTTRCFLKFSCVSTNV
jgi:hypothetical protein